MSKLHIVFDGPPGPECGRFVEVEQDDGSSVSVGEWVDRGNGLHALVIDDPRPLRAEVERLASKPIDAVYIDGGFYRRDAIVGISRSGTVMLAGGHTVNVGTADLAHHHRAWLKTPDPDPPHRARPP